MSAAALPSDLSASHDLLHALLDVSLPGVILFRPVYGADDPATVVDLAYVHLNPAAQQMLNLPARPADSFLTLYPNTRATGIFAFYRDTFLSGQAGEYAVNYPYDGLNNFFQLSARRSGELLVVGFTDTAAQDRSAVEQALRESQAHEQAAHAVAEQQRQRLREVLTQMPAYIAVYQGPDHIYQFVNPAYQRLFPHRSFLGKPFREGTPEAEALGVVALFDQVYRTGEPVYLREMEGWFDFHGNGQPVQVFLNISLQPLRDVQGRIDGVMDFTYDVSEQVRARQQVEQLNQELEARAQVRAGELVQAQAETEVQRRRLHQLVAEAPALIASLRGPDHYVELANDSFRELLGGRELAGRPYRQALPELESQPFFDQLDHVYRTGETYYGVEQPAALDRDNSGRLATYYFNYIYQATRDAQGQVDGILLFAYEVTEQVLARQERETQRQQLQAVFEQAPVPITVFRGPDLVVESANAAICALWGRPAAQVLGRPYFAAVPDTAGQGFEEILAGVLHTGQPFLMNEMPATLDRAHTGQPAAGVFNFVFQPLFGSAGPQEAPLGIVAIGTEVTAQVRARQQVEQANEALEARVAARTRALREAQATAERERGQLQTLITQAPVAIALLQGDELRVVSANDLITELWGYTPADVVGRPLLEGVPELQGQGFDDLMREVMRTQVPFIGKETAAVMLRHGQLQTSYFDFVYHPQYDAGGQVQGVIIVATDMTEQVRSRQQVEQLNAELETRVQQRTRELSEQRQLLNLILAQVPASIATLTGPEHRFSFFNEPYQQLTAGRAELGRTAAEALPEVVEQGFIRLLDQVYVTGQPFVGRDIPISLDNANNGQPEARYLDFIYQPLFDQAQQVQGILAFILDVTEKAQARQQVQHLNEELAAINEEMQVTNEELHDTNTRLQRTNTDLDTFVYAASHDLKAPIANIEGLIEALREYLPTLEQEPMVPRLVGMIEGAIGRFQQTVAHLTDVTRLQAGSEPVTGDVDVPGLLEDVRLDVQPLLESSRTQLRLDVPACPGVRIPAKHLRSILFNLLSNAVKYRAPDRPPVVQVRARCAAGRFVLEVQDNGLGLSETQQGQLFTMFRRLHTHVEGSGVGLYLIKRMIELAGGTIAVASQPGVGSTFTVTLPAA